MSFGAAVEVISCGAESSGVAAEAAASVTWAVNAVGANAVEAAGAVEAACAVAAAAAEAANLACNTASSSLDTLSGAAAQVQLCLIE